MEYRACPVCDAQPRNVFLRGPDLLHNVPGEFTLSRCECGLVFVNPMPTNDELQRYYPDDYCPHRTLNVDTTLKKHRCWKVFILRWYYGSPVDGPPPPRRSALVGLPGVDDPAVGVVAERTAHAVFHPSPEVSRRADRRCSPPAARPAPWSPPVDSPGDIRWMSRGERVERLWIPTPV